MVVRDVRAARRVPGTGHARRLSPSVPHFPARAWLAGKRPALIGRAPPPPAPWDSQRGPGTAPAPREPLLLAAEQGAEGERTTGPQQPGEGRGGRPGLAGGRAQGRGQGPRLVDGRASPAAGTVAESAGAALSRPRVLGARRPGGRGRGPGSRRRLSCSPAARHGRAPGKSESLRLP